MTKDKMKSLDYLFDNIDTVEGRCEACEETTILVALVKEYYRCTHCGEDTKQHINGRIRYMQLSDSDIKIIKKHRSMNI